MEIDKYESLHAHGIVIPCPHNNPTESDLYCSLKKLQVRLVFDVHETLVYYPNNGRKLLVSKQKLPIIKNSINPFCSFCRSIIDGYLISSNNADSFERATEKLKLLRNEVWEKVEAIKRRHGCIDEKNLDMFNHTSVVRVNPERICSGEEFRGWVSTGNEVIIEMKIPLIKGLKNVVSDNDAGKYLEMENLCSICLQKLKFVDAEEEENAKIDTTATPIVDDFVGLATKSLVKLHCEHVFHEPCIVRWLLKNPICPYCRYELS